MEGPISQKSLIIILTIAVFTFEQIDVLVRMGILLDNSFHTLKPVLRKRATVHLGRRKPPLSPSSDVKESWRFNLHQFP